MNYKSFLSYLKKYAPEILLSGGIATAYGIKLRMHNRKITSNNWRKMHHLPMRRRTKR